MPIYEYRCRACGCELEVIQKIAEVPLTDCPQCGKSAFEKVISSTQFHLKGSGWYETDYKSGGKPRTQQAAGGDEGSVNQKPQTAPATSTDCE